MTHLRRGAVAPFALSALGLALGLASATPAQASDAECVDAHRTVQLARREHRLLEAQRAASVCAQSRCPNLIGADCRTWLPELESQAPSVVFDVVGSDGRPLSGALRIEVDGEPVDVPPGQSFALDPGEHRFRLQRAEGPPLAVRAVVLEGRKAQPVRAVFPVDGVPAPAGSKGPPLVTYVLGGAGIAALGVAAGFGIDGLSRKGALDDLGCRPGCDSSRVSAVERSFLVADVSLGIGLVLTAAAAAFWIFRGAPAAPQSARTSPASDGDAPLVVRF